MDIQITIFIRCNSKLIQNPIFAFSDKPIKLRVEPQAYPKFKRTITGNIAKIIFAIPLE